jgi:hypothetical protein
VYSLVSAPVLGFDLTRLPGGSATAEVLVRALCMQEEDLAILAGQLAAEDTRATLWLEVDAAAARVQDLQSIVDDEDPARALALLERAPVGSLDALLRLVRTDVMSWTWRDDTGVPGGRRKRPRQSETATRATSLLCDAAVATYLREHLSETVRRGLSAGWVAAVRRLPTAAPVDLGPHHYAVSALLQRLGTVRPEDVRRLSSSADDSRRNPGGWSSAVHSATWAAYLADRVRTAAVAQLLLVQAIDIGAFPLTNRAAGVWNVLSGGVQALVVRDLLDTSTAHRLLAPVLAALGPAWLS